MSHLILGRELYVLAGHGHISKADDYGYHPTKARG